MCFSRQLLPWGLRDAGGDHCVWRDRAASGATRRADGVRYPNRAVAAPARGRADDRFHAAAVAAARSRRDGLAGVAAGAVFLAAEGIWLAVIGPHLRPGRHAFERADKVGFPAQPAGAGTAAGDADEL